MSEGQNNIYEPEVETFWLKVPTDPLLPSVEEVKEGWLEKIKEIFSRSKKKKYRTVEISIYSASPAKIFQYLKMSLTEGRKLNSIFSEYTDVKNKETDDFSALVDKLFIEALNNTLEYVAHSDDVIRFIIDDKKLSNGFDFVPFLTITQRLAIINAFKKVNPVMNDAQKKIVEMVGIMSEDQDSLIKEAEELEKQSQKLSKNSEQE